MRTQKDKGTIAVGGREMVLSKNMQKLVAGSSTIRKLFEEGIELAKEVGAGNVYDFSLGNPAAPVPEEVKKSIYDILENRNANFVHCYMPNAGYPEVREKVAANLNKKYNSSFTKDDIIMTVGAAGGINCVLRSLLEPEDEVLCFAPFFGEYNSYVMNFGGNLKVVPADYETFQLNVEEADKYITERTKAVIINNPNNPSGVVYNKETLIRLQKMLEKAEERIGHPIYVLSDEPYRELVYDGCELPFAPDYIKNCIVVYSFSKSLSLSGERIGYMAVSRQIAEYDTMINALVVANRCIGYINAPSLFQLVVADCLDVKTDVEFYDRNRKLLYESMKDMGFECVKPEGAFYMLVKAPTGDDAEFSAAAKKFNLLIVPATSFGCPGYVRMAYCVSNEMIHRALPALQKLADHYGLKK